MHTLYLFEPSKLSSVSSLPHWKQKRHCTSGLWFLRSTASARMCSGQRPAHSTPHHSLLSISTKPVGLCVGVSWLPAVLPQYGSCARKCCCLCSVQPTLSASIAHWHSLIDPFSSNNMQNIVAHSPLPATSTHASSCSTVCPLPAGLRNTLGPAIARQHR